MDRRETRRNGKELEEMERDPSQPHPVPLHPVPSLSFLSRPSTAKRFSRGISTDSDPCCVPPFHLAPIRSIWSIWPLLSIWFFSVPSNLSVSSSPSPFLLVPLRSIWSEASRQPATSVVWLLLHAHLISWTLVKVIHDIRQIRLKLNMTKHRLNHFLVKLI